MDKWRFTIVLSTAIAFGTGHQRAGAILLLIVLGACILALVRYYRGRRQQSASLRKMNRGNIDLQSDWVKKPWQHDEGECRRREEDHAARIEAYAAQTGTLQNIPQDAQHRRA